MAQLDEVNSPLLTFETTTLKDRLSSVNFKISSGERVAIVGPNGAGKSTLLRLSLGLEKPDAGAVRLGKANAFSLPALERAKLVAWLPQRLTVQSDFRALDLVAAPRLIRGESSANAHGKARATLDELGALDLETRYADTLSGGELQRVLLAAVLTQDTPLILADEPANHLDPYYQLLIYEQLRRLADEGKAVIVVTHDVALLSRLGEPAQVRVLGLGQGALTIDTHADDPKLTADLTRLFRVPVVRDGSGNLSIQPGSPNQ